MRPLSKHCAKCDQYLEADKFASNRSKSTGLNSYCKICDQNRQRVYRTANREYVRLRARNRYAEIVKNLPKAERSHARWTELEDSMISDEISNRVLSERLKRSIDSIKSRKRKLRKEMVAC